MVAKQSITHWIYPLSERSGRTFGTAHGAVQASVASFYNSYKHERVSTWYLSHGYRIMQPGDFVWAYFGGRDRIVVGVGVVERQPVFNPQWQGYAIDIRWDVALTEHLRRQPIRYDQYGQHVQSAANRANDDTTRVFEGWLKRNRIAPDSRKAKQIAFAIRETRARTGQQSFREDVLEHFGRRCCITRCTTVSALEAAHIVPVAADGLHERENALLLRSDIHRLFDDGLLNIDPKSFKVVVSDSIRDPEYRKLHGKVVAIPAYKGPVSHRLRQRAKVFPAT